MKKNLFITFLDFDDIRNPLLSGGQAKATFEVGRRLASKGHKILVLCSKYPGHQDRTEKGINYKHIGLGSKSIRLNNLAYIFCLPFHVMRTTTDFFLECFTAPISTLGSPLFTQKPVIAIPTSFDAHRFSQQYHLPFHLVEQSLLKYYRYFLPFTPEMDQKLKKCSPHAQTDIVPNGVDDIYFQLKPSKPKHILFIGRLDIGQKGIDLLLKAYQSIPPHLRKPLMIAGEGPDKEGVIKLIEQAGLKHHVSVLGNVTGKKKTQLFKQAFLVVVPSREESFCLVALEALAAGLPVLAFDIPGLSWAKNSFVHKIKTFDLDQYCQKMIELTHNKKNDITTARKFARHFSWDKTAKKYLAFISKISKK